MKKNELRKLQLEEKNILDYFVKFCQENNLTYYLAYGTLLGAVRHKGFIPWDDDIDIYMLPDDYLKFIRLFKSTDDYILQNIETELYFHTTLTKIRKNNTCMIEEDWKYVKIHKGINIDVFPLLPYPDSKFGKIKFQFKLRIATLFVSKNLHAKNLKNKIIFSILKIIPRKVTNKWADKIIINLLNYNGKYSNYKSEVRNKIYKKEWFMSNTKLLFENDYYISPGNYHELLKELYGDYMKLPDKNQRYGHGFGNIILSFDKNYEDLDI